MKTNTNRGFFGMMAVIAAAILALGFSSCAFSADEGSSGGGGDIRSTLEFETLSRLAFMGGSLIYNPDLGVDGQISNGAVIAVRLSRVEITDDAETPDEQYKETSSAYGYITVKTVNIDSITLAYAEYTGTGELKPARTTTVTLNSTGDINGDGLADVSFAPPAMKRSGMENAIFLTFIASQENGNVGMYSVIPEQYSRQAYPNGIMGVNPNGQLIISKFQPSGERSAIRGAEYGDIIVDNKQNSYGIIKNGAHFRSAAQRIGDTPDDVTDVAMGSDWGGDETPEIEAGENTGDDDIVYPDDPNPDEVDMTGEPDYFDENQFTPYATPRQLFDELPSSLKASISMASLSTEAEYIDALNEILDILPATLIEAVLSDKTFDAEFENGANALKGEDSGAAGELHAIAVNRAFLAKAYPELCQPPAAKTVQEMFPILSLSFSVGDAEEVLEEQLMQIRRANQEFAYIRSTNNARAAAKGYTTYTSRKKDIQTKFNRNFTNIGTITLNKDMRDKLEANFDDANLSVDIGLYGSIVNHWGKIELGVGAALLLNAEVGGPKGSYTFKGPELSIKKSVVAGPVLLDVGLSGETGITVEVKNGLLSNYYAGFIGMYGGRVWVGANYGIKWKWKIIPVGGYFKPYAKGEKIAETAYYFGPKTTERVSSAAASGSIIVTPYVSFGPTLTLWKTIYGKIGADASLPNTLAYTNKGANANYSLDLVLGVSASAGIKFDFKIFSYKREFGKWTIVKSEPIPIVKTTKAW